MSLISNTHSVIAFESGKTKPLDGQRLAKVTYKVDKKTGIKPDSKAVSIPMLTWEHLEPQHIQALKGEFMASLHKIQDAIVRNKVESGASSIHEDDIGLDAIIRYTLEESGRITGDVIRGWFQDSIREPLMLAFASKLGIAEDATPTKEQEDKLSKILKGYEDSFAKLASGAASFNEAQKTNMLKALEFAEDDDALASRFTERLSKVKSDDELLMAL